MFPISIKISCQPEDTNPTNPSKTQTHKIKYYSHEEAEGHNAKEEAAQNDVVAVEGPLDGKHQAVIRSRQEQAPM